MYLRATIWKLCVTAVKRNSCLQFAPLRSRRTEVRAPIYTQFYSPSTGQGGTGGSNGHRRRNRRFTMQKPQLLQLVAINSPGYVVLDLSLGGGVRDTVSFLSYPLTCFHWADWDFLASVDRESRHLPAPRWGTTMNVVSSSLPSSPQKATTAASQSTCFLTEEVVVEERGLLRHHLRGWTCPVSPAGC